MIGDSPGERVLLPFVDRDREPGKADRDLAIEFVKEHGLEAYDLVGGVRLGHLIQIMEYLGRMRALSRQEQDRTLAAGDVDPFEAMKLREQLERTHDQLDAKRLTGSCVAVYEWLCNTRGFAKISVEALVALRTEVCRAETLPPSSVDKMRSLELSKLLGASEAAADRPTASKPADPAAPVPTKNDERDAFAHNCRRNGMSNKEIRKAIKRRRDWTQIDTDAGVRMAIKRYCEHHKLPRPS